MSNVSGNASDHLNTELQDAHSGTSSYTAAIEPVLDLSGVPQGSNRSSRLLAHLHAPQPYVHFRTNRGRPDSPNVDSQSLRLRPPLAGHPTADLTSEERQRKNRRQLEIKIEEEQYRELFESKRKYDMEIALSAGLPRAKANQLGSDLEVNPDNCMQYEDGETDSEGEDNDESECTARFATPTLVPRELDFTPFPGYRNTPHSIEPQLFSPPSGFTSGCSKDILEREFELAAAEIQSAALQLRRFEDRRGLSILGGVDSSLRSRLPRKMETTRTVPEPTANLNVRKHRSPHFRRRFRSPIPIAGPSSVTIENMLEAEKRQRLDDTPYQPSSGDTSPIPHSQHVFPYLTTTRIMTRARARTLAKGKARAL